MNDQPSQQWPPVSPPQWAATPSAAPSVLPQPRVNQPNTVHLHTNTNPTAEGLKMALMAIATAFLIVLFVDLLVANYLFVRALMVANELSKQFGQ